MMKRLLLALALAGSIGGALAACNTPAASTTPASSTSGGGTTTSPSLDAGSSPAESMALPSAS